MNKNIGTTDRLLRFILACIFFALALWLKSWILALVGLFTLFEALASWCIIYQMIGKNTCNIPRNNGKKK